MNAITSHKLSALAAVSAMLLPSLAQAATLRSIQGDVRVNQGEGFKSAKGTVALKVGDTVMASPGSQAQISYADGCLVAIDAGIVASVTARSPCTIAKAEVPGPSYLTGDPLPSPSPSLPPFTPSLMIGAMGAFGVVSVVTLVAEIEKQKEKDRNRFPASP